jgi:hypothetical protein
MDFYSGVASAESRPTPNPPGIQSIGNIELLSDLEEKEA